MLESKKKILIISYGLDIGGIERSLIGLLDVLDYEKYEVDLLLFSHDGEFFNLINPKVNLLPRNNMMHNIKKPILYLFKSGNFKLGFIRVWAKIVTVISSKILKKPSSLMSRVYRIADKYFFDINKKYDISLGFFGPFDYLINHVDAKLKVGWIHTDYSKIQIDVNYELKNWKQLDYISAVSEDSEKSFITVFPSLEDKVIVIENILDPEFVRQQAELIDVSNNMEKKNNEIILCTVGRFSNAKGFDLAIEACEMLIKCGLNIKWYGIGYGPDEYMLKDLIKEKNLQNYFILLGKKPNPYGYIKACDIYVQPSRYEGKAVTVREAQILEKPVLITNFTTAKSQLIHGEDGHICELSIEGIVEGVKHLINNPLYRAKLINGTKNNEYGNQEEVKKINKLIELY